MVSEPANTRVAFFGATGGCTLSCLIPALEGGYPCVALVRTPEKLTNLLNTRNVCRAALSNLTIIPGSSTDPVAVQKTLTPLPSIIITGVGGAMDFSKPLKPTLDNPTICQDTMRTIHSVTSELSSGLPLDQKPFLGAISSTGISDGKRDVPLAMIPMYHWMLKQPHADKKAMEQIIEADKQEVGGKARAFRDYCIIRPSFLTDGNVRYPDVRTGDGAGRPAVGYTISRTDVGLWMFHNLVERKEGSFGGQFVSLTY